MAPLAALLSAPPEGLSVQLSPGQVTIHKPADRSRAIQAFVFLSGMLAVLLLGISVSVGSPLPLLGMLLSVLAAPLLATEAIILTPHAVRRTRTLGRWYRRPVDVSLSDIEALATETYLQTPDNPPIKRLRLTARGAAPMFVGHNWSDDELVWLDSLLHAARTAATEGSAAEIPAALRLLSAKADRQR